MKRTMKKSISLLMALCMILGLLPAMSVTAGAMANDSWVGAVSFDSSADAKGAGWRWDGTAKTLTLSGVNVTEGQADNRPRTCGIYINGDAKLILEGANKVALDGDYGVCCNGDLEIKGSGTLDVALNDVNSKTYAGAGLHAMGNLTVSSGRITCATDVGQGEGAGISTGTSTETPTDYGTLTINGGYISAVATGKGDGVKGSVEMNGGYLYVEGGGSAIYGISIKVTGGYLEAYAPNRNTDLISNAIFAITDSGTFENSGGVVKAKADDASYRAISAGSITFSGGVTIATGGGASKEAIQVRGSIAASNDEKYWESPDGVVSGSGDDIEDYLKLVSPHSVVIAKEAYGTAQTALTTLDGTYIKVASGSAFKTPSSGSTVTGGSYLEGGIGADMAAGNLAISGTRPTLVCYGTTNGVENKSHKRLEVKSGGTLYAFSSNGYGILNGEFTVHSATCNAIAVGKSGGFLFDDYCNFNAGYVYGGGSGAGSVGITSSSTITSYAYVTAQGEASGLSLTGSNKNLSLKDNSAMTCIGGTKGFSGIATAPSLPAVEKEAYGSTADPAAPGALAEATYDTTDKTYKLGGSACKVVYFSKTPPVTYPVWVGGVQLTEEDVDATTGAVSGMTGVTYAPAAGGNPATLTLDGANITAATAITRTEASSTELYSAGIFTEEALNVVLADGSVNTLNGAAAEGTLPQGTNITSAGIYSNCDGMLTISGTGKLTTTGAGVVGHSYGIYGKDLVIDSGTITATGGFIAGAAFSAGIYGDSIVINDGSVTASSVATAEMDYTCNVFGIYPASSLEINGGTVIASVNSGLVYANPIYIFYAGTPLPNLADYEDVTVKAGTSASNAAVVAEPVAATYTDSLYVRIGLANFISFDARNGVAIDDVEIGESMTLPSIPEWNNYTFAGWYDGKDGAGDRIIDANGAFVEGKKPTSSTALYAKWTKGTGDDLRTVRTVEFDIRYNSSPYKAYQSESGVVESPTGVYTKASEGWSWDTNTNTMTLSGAVFNNKDSDQAVYLPANATLSGTGTFISGGVDTNAIRVNGDLKIDSADITAAGTWLGIDGDGSIEISGSKVTASGSGSKAISISAYGGTLTAPGATGTANTEAATAGTTPFALDDIANYKWLSISTLKTYPVWVGGVRLTKENVNAQTGAVTGMTGVKYTPAKDGNAAILALNNATISGGAGAHPYGIQVGKLGTPTSLTLELTGTNVINGVTEADKSAMGIRVDIASALTIQQTAPGATLDINYNNADYGIYAASNSTVTMKSGEVTIHPSENTTGGRAGQAAISGSTLTIDGGKLVAIGNPNGGDGIWANTFAINGGEVTAIGGSTWGKAFGSAPTLAPGYVAKTNITTTAGEGTYSAADIATYKWVNIAFAPSLSVTAPAKTYTYGTANSESLTVTAPNFGDPYEDYAPQIQWVTTSHDGVTVEIDTADNKTVNISTTAAANAGKYEFKVVSPKTDSGNYESAQVTLTIGKADYVGTAAKTVYLMTNKTDVQGGTLTATDFFTTTPAGAKITVVAIDSAVSGILSNTPTLSAGTLSYSGKANLTTAGQTDTYDVTIESTNYNDITATLSFTTIDKTPVTISGVEMDEVNYTYGEQPSFDKTDLNVAGATPEQFNPEDLKYQYSGTGNTTYGPSDAAPSDAGSYQLVVSVPADNPTYIGSQIINFTIDKKPITVKPNAKRITTNAAMPAFDLDLSGVLAADKTTADFTELLSTCTFAPQTSASDPTVLTSTATAGTYIVRWTNMSTMRDNISSWPDYGNYIVTWEDTAAFIISAHSSGGGSTPVNTNVPVIVDGQEYNIGTAKTSGSVTTVTVDQAELQKQLDTAKETVVVPITPGKNADTVTAQLVVANVNEMAEKEMTLSVQVDNVSYDMRTVAIDTEALMAELGAADATQVPVSVTIKTLPDSAVTLENGTLVLPPVSFDVTATFSGKTIEVGVFEKYVQRVIKVPSTVDAGKITTAVVVENGTQRHVPTNVFEKDGKWYAQINSLTNSTYALISYETSFTDAEGKWFESVVNEMASRGVVSGRGDGIFDGDANITRAEFAAILVRALGLPESDDTSAFTDVSKDDWYVGAVGKAYEYSLVSGRGDGIFDPTANITRQEAMAMVHRAAAITELAGTAGTLDTFSDADSISAWALTDAQWNVGSGLIQGNSAGEILGQSNITRGETATIVLRLLQKSELVDVRTKA